MSGYGKIARLPASVRNQVYQRMYDNEPQEETIAWLEAQGHTGILRQNLSSAKEGGPYAAWLRRRQRIEDMRSRVEFAKELYDVESGEFASDGASRMAVDNILEVLENFDSVDLLEKLKEKPEKFIDLVHALSSLRKRDQDASALHYRIEEWKLKIADLARTAKTRAKETGNADLAQIADQMDMLLSGGG